MNLAEQFHAWALEPARTDEELFVVELVAESAQRVSDRKRNVWQRDFEAERERCKRRRLNPAYRPKLSRGALDLVVELWSEITGIDNGAVLDEDRPVRDLSALRFFPHLRELKLRSELADLAGLAAVPQLKKLELIDEVITDLGPLSQLQDIEELTLRLAAPWPALDAIATLRALKNVSFTGNLLAWRAVPELPAATRVRLHAGPAANTPLRDARELPAMPGVSNLHLDGIADLRGLERFAATLRQLEVTGPYVDLQPLAELRETRSMKLSGERFMDLRPVAQMPRLRTLELWRFRGIDVAPLTDAPRLRRVEANLNDVIKTELATLNAAIGFVDEAMFQAEVQDAPPLRFLACDRTRDDYKAHARKSPPPNPREAEFDDDPILGPAEERWFERRVTQRLNELLEAGWGRINAWQPGSANLEIRRYADMTHLREIVQIVHDAIAAARFPWTVMLIVEPHGDLSEDMEDIEDRYGGEDDEAAEEEQDREELQEQRRAWREHKEFLEREHRLRLQQQEGFTINPQEFAPPPSPVEQEAEASAEEVEDDAEATGLGQDFHLRLDVDRAVVWVDPDEAERAAYFLGEKFEDWHAMPEPPERRPRFRGV